MVKQEMVFGALNSHDFLPGMSRWAAALRSYLIYSYEEWVEEHGTTLKYSAAAIFDRSGRRVSTYERIVVVLSCMCSSGDLSLRYSDEVKSSRYRKQRITHKERSAGYSEGRGGLTPIRTDFGCFAVLICQDLFYPELWEEAHQLGVDMMVWPSAFEGGGFLSAYARLYSMVVIPAAPAAVHLTAYDMTGGSHVTPVFGLILPNSRLENDVAPSSRTTHVQLVRSWFVHTNSRIVCRPNLELSKYTERLQKAGSLKLIPIAHVLWEGCYALQGISSRIRVAQGCVHISRWRPSFRVDSLLMAARVLPRGPLAQGQHHREGDGLENRNLSIKCGEEGCKVSLAQGALGD